MTQNATRTVQLRCARVRCGTNVCRGRCFVLLVRQLPQKQLIIQRHGYCDTIAKRDYVSPHHQAKVDKQCVPDCCGGRCRNAASAEVADRRLSRPASAPAATAPKAPAEADIIGYSTLKRCTSPGCEPGGGSTASYGSRDEGRCGGAANHKIKLR